ncbi:hypothetical protein Baya_16135 [Bagarius yarrelli]|uniref:Uncharacterized protein n=1 Tax=Bagarius yarrelli TaxID=175774 RepID=A0A556VUN5_BAGYA|nr:hypothetical protein Baya_16135 [Bagarius yarrelli]
MGKGCITATKYFLFLFNLLFFHSRTRYYVHSPSASPDAASLDPNHNEGHGLKQDVLRDGWRLMRCIYCRLWCTKTEATSAATSSSSSSSFSGRHAEPQLQQFQMF